MTEYISAEFYSVGPWRELMENLFVFLNSQENFCPEVWGFGEPLQEKFPPPFINEALDLWEKRGRVMFSRSKHETYIMRLNRRMRFEKNRQPNKLSMVMKEAFFAADDNIAQLLVFTRDLINRSKVIYGHINHSLDYARQNELNPMVRVDGVWVSSIGGDIRPHLPGIYWANFFGKTYVDWFGREKFNTIPNYAKEEVPGSGFLILTAPSPLDFEQSWELPQAIKSHLGEAAFADIKNPHRTYRSPFKDGTIDLDKIEDTATYTLDKTDKHIFPTEPKADDFIEYVEHFDEDAEWEYSVFIHESAEEYLGRERFDLLEKQIAEIPGVEAAHHEDRELFLIRTKTLTADEIKARIWELFLESPN